MKKLVLSRIKDKSKENILKERIRDSEYKKLIENLDSTKEELAELNQSLRFVTDPILINQLIFQINAAEVRYRYWFCLARNSKKENEKTQTNVWQNLRIVVY